MVFRIYVFHRLKGNQVNARTWAVIVSLTITVGTTIGLASPAAASSTCYGESCVGLNPALTSCANDAKTIGAMDVMGSGMLELRWSRSCNASWGRFSTYWLYDITNASAKTGISYARVTAWNPGQPSQEVIESRTGTFTGSTYWTGMVSGDTWSCTGVELLAQDAPATGSNWYTDTTSLGWVWGPCVA